MIFIRMTKKIQTIDVCGGSDCARHGASDVLQVLQDRFEKEGVEVNMCGCVNRCAQAVNVIVDDTHIFSYSKSRTIVERIEGGAGESMLRHTEDTFDISDDFLGDV